MYYGKYSLIVILLPGADLPVGDDERLRGRSCWSEQQGRHRVRKHPGHLRVSQQVLQNIQNILQYVLQYCKMNNSSTPPRCEFRYYSTAVCTVVVHVQDLYNRYYKYTLPQQFTFRKHQHIYNVHNRYCNNILLPYCKHPLEYV